VGAAGAVAVEATAHAVLGDDRAPAPLRREAAAVLAAAGSSSGLGALNAAVGDVDREVRAIAANAITVRRPDAAVATIRALGNRADATTIAPLALAAWPQLAAELIAEPATRAWSMAVSLIGGRVDELIAIATAKGSDTVRIAAIAALGRLGGEQARHALEAIHRNAEQPDAIKLAAWKALRRLQRRVAKIYAEGQDKGPQGSAIVDSTAHDDDVGDNEQVSDDEDSDDGDDDNGDDDEGDDAADASADEDGEDDDEDDEDDDDDE
jgi:HEAT repeat protein